MTHTRRARFDPDRILAALGDHAVSFVLIGGLAGAARGAGWPTFDVDIVVAADEENLARLDAALSALDAEYDTFHQPPIRPDRRRLRASHGPQLFRTRHGRLDVLKEAGGESYEKLAEDASEVRVHGHVAQCASLAALLRMKRAANRPKDQPAIAKLEEALRRERPEE